MDLRTINFSSFKGFDDATIEHDDIALINQLLNSRNDIDYSGKVVELEKAFSNYIGVEHTYAFFKGRQALSAIIKALELKKNDEIIVPGYTCIVVANSIINIGLKPVYCDIELDTYGPELESIKQLVTANTKAIITHHLYGLVSRDYGKILEFAERNNYYIIDDCTQATGATYNNKKLGYYSDAAFYSLQHSKVISCGDGGIATTNDYKIGEKLKSVQIRSKNVSSTTITNTLRTVKRIYYFNQNRFLGRLVFNYYKIMGWRDPDNISNDEIDGKPVYDDTYKLPNSLATLALKQLKKIDYFNEKRKNNSKLWSQWSAKFDLSIPLVIQNSKPIFLRYPIMINNGVKEKIFQELGKDLQIGYWFSEYLDPGPIERQPDPKILPNATQAIKNIINLPCL